MCGRCIVLTASLSLLLATGCGYVSGVVEGAKGGQYLLHQRQTHKEERRDKALPPHLANEAADKLVALVSQKLPRHEYVRQYISTNDVRMTLAIGDAKNRT